MLKAELVSRGRTCVCGSKILQNDMCIVEIIGSGKWTRKKSLCRNCGTAALIKERDKLSQLETQVYGQDGA
jgi:DNA-directed RNA polymerase subunit RPC12/RpoP